MQKWSSKLSVVFRVNSKREWIFCRTETFNFRIRKSNNRVRNWNKQGKWGTAKQSQTEKRDWWFIYMIADKRKLEVVVLLSYPWRNIEHLANWRKVSIEADSFDTETIIQYLKCLPKRLRYEFYFRNWKIYFTSKDFLKALEEFEHWIVLHNNGKFEIQYDRSIIEEDIFRRKFKIRNTLNRKIEAIEYEQLIEFLNKT